MKVRVEVCVTGPGEALAAQGAGADTVELCSWLAVGGVTPSFGSVRTVSGMLHLPVRVLLRAEPGGFLYTGSQIGAMLEDARLLAAHGHGLVVGALNSDGTADLTFLHAVREAAPASEITFHRAIDRSGDPLGCFAQCMGAGVQRVLTSGARDRAIDGVATIKAMVDAARGGIRVAAAGGIGPGNVVELVERTGVTEVHFAAQRSAPGPVDQVRMSSGGGPESLLAPDLAKIEGVLNALTKAGLR